MEILADIIRAARLGRLVARLWDANADSILSGAYVAGISGASAEAHEALMAVEAAWGVSLNPYGVRTAADRQLSW
jgi:hypothetical protein